MKLGVRCTSLLCFAASFGHHVHPCFCVLPGTSLHRLQRNTLASGNGNRSLESTQKTQDYQWSYAAVFFSFRGILSPFFCACSLFLSSCMPTLIFLWTLQDSVSLSAYILLKA